MLLVGFSKFISVIIIAMLKKLSNTIYTQISLSVLYLLSPISFALAQTGSNSAVQLVNPLRVNTIEELLVAILNVLIIIAIPIIVIFIILAGFKYVTARGNPQQIEEASRALTYAIIGGVLVIGAVAIAEIIKNFVQTF